MLRSPEARVSRSPSTGPRVGSQHVFATRYLFPMVGCKGSPLRGTPSEKRHQDSVCIERATRLLLRMPRGRALPACAAVLCRLTLAISSSRATQHSHEFVHLSLRGTPITGMRRRQQAHGSSPLVPQRFVGRSQSRRCSLSKSRPREWARAPTVGQINRFEFHSVRCLPWPRGKPQMLGGQQLA